MLLETLALVRAIKTGKSYIAYPADWGPHHSTNRIADISPGLMGALGIETDDEVEIIFPYQQGVVTMPYESIVISSGHSKYVRGASDELDEVTEARRVAERVADKLEARGIDVTVFHDNTSHTQSENLNCIVTYHNSCERDLDVSVHFNAYVETDKPMGTEVLYVTQGALAGEMSRAIAKAGDFIDRGAKKRTDLVFLNGTEMPSILIETCFVDSTVRRRKPTKRTSKRFAKPSRPCWAAPSRDGDRTAAGEVIEPPPTTQPSVRLDIQVVGDVTVIVNGVPVT